MKLIRNLIIFIIIIAIFGAIGINYIQVSVNEDELPTVVYEEDADLGSLINTNLMDLYLGIGSQYTVIEETLNLVILDSIHENINADYDPLSSCETEACNFILHEDYYYVNYVWAELTQDNQMMVHVSFGSDKIINVNTVLTMYFDIEFNFVEMSATLTLDKYDINEHDISIKVLDRIFNYLDKEEIENSVTQGELNLSDYSYTISFLSSLPSFPPFS